MRKRVGKHTEASTKHKTMRKRVASTQRQAQNIKQCESEWQAHRGKHKISNDAKQVASTQRQAQNIKRCESKWQAPRDPKR